MTLLWGLFRQPTIRAAFATVVLLLSICAVATAVDLPVFDTPYERPPMNNPTTAIRADQVQYIDVGLLILALGLAEHLADQQALSLPQVEHAVGGSLPGLFYALSGESGMRGDVGIELGQGVACELGLPVVGQHTPLEVGA